MCRSPHQLTTHKRDHWKDSALNEFSAIIERRNRRYIYAGARLDIQIFDRRDLHRSDVNIANRLSTSWSSRTSGNAANYWSIYWSLGVSRSARRTTDARAWKPQSWELPVATSLSANLCAKNTSLRPWPIISACNSSTKKQPKPLLRRHTDRSLLTCWPSLPAARPTPRIAPSWPAEITAEHGELAAALSRLADDFQFDEILTLARATGTNNRLMPQ